MGTKRVREDQSGQKGYFVVSGTERTIKYATKRREDCEETTSICLRLEARRCICFQVGWQLRL